jgi:TM2 domain-containing membrane protein YozV
MIVAAVARKMSAGRAEGIKPQGWHQRTKELTMSDTSVPETPKDPSVSTPEPAAVPEAAPEPESATQATPAYPYADQQSAAEPQVSSQDYQQGYQQGYQQPYQQDYQQTYQQVPPAAEQQGAPYAQQNYQQTPAYQPPMYPGAKPTRYRKERLVAGILALALGTFGAHKFYLGYTTEAVIMLLLVTVGSCLAVGPLVAAIIGLVEGIIYLLKSDEEFEQAYVYNKKGWF